MGVWRLVSSARKQQLTHPLPSPASPPNHKKTQTQPGAAFYANQSVIGEGLADFIAAGRRGELFITSKIWQVDHRPAAARASCVKTLQELGVGGGGGAACVCLGGCCCVFVCCVFCVVCCVGSVMGGWSNLTCSNCVRLFLFLSIITPLTPTSTRQTDYLDLLLVHWPEAWLPGSTLDDYQTDAEVTLVDTWCARCPGAHAL